MRSSLLILAAFVQIGQYYCFLETSYVVYAIFAAGAGYFYTKKCDYVECCEIIEPTSFQRKLIDSLKSKVFGQPIVLKVLPAAIHTHINKQNPNSPLVISLHGWTGSGKTYTSQLIAQAMFKKGLNSINVKKISPATFFPNPNQVNFYKSILVDTLMQQASLCKYSLIIIEEIDKLHPELIEVLSSFLNNYHPSINHLTFIFTSNVGSDKVVEKTLELYEAGKKRDDIQLNDFEKIIRDQVYNDESAMKYSSLITSHLINHYVPYLPLERTHVAMCTLAYVNEHIGYMTKANFDKVRETVFDSVEWWPKDLKLYSTSGCKQVGIKVDIIWKMLH